MDPVFDILIIGGGINGTAIAADAAGRGLSVALCEKNDLASGTSSASTKLIHGGLRYLESYEFNLVRKALKEREILMRRAPNLIRPLEFILPYEKHLRPMWLIRLGLFLYDHLSKRVLLEGSKTISLVNTIQGKVLQPIFKKGFSYFDCFAEDARLVILNALSAKNNGAQIFTQTEFISARKEDSLWKITLKDHSANPISIIAKGILNVAGPWVNLVQANIEEANVNLDIKLDKGSHIVVPKLFEGNFAYILQNLDARIVFAIPYQNDFTLIGTTDVPYQQSLDDLEITTDEINYLCTTINSHFIQKISPNEIIWSYSGVRCLQADTNTRISQLSRDYKLLLNGIHSPFLLTVIGGKLTTHRTLAEEAVNLLINFFPKMGKAWTALRPLPGCDFPEQNIEKFYQQFQKDFSWLPTKLAERYATNYGTFAYRFLENCHSLNDLGKRFSDELYQREVEYLIENEWAKTEEDILWRRTKLGLTMTEHNKKQLATWLREYPLIQNR